MTGWSTRQLVIANISGVLILSGIGYLFLQNTGILANCSKVESQLHSLNEIRATLQNKVNDDQDHIGASNILAGSSDGTGLFNNVRQQWVLQYQADNEQLTAIIKGTIDLKSKYPQCN